MQHLQPYTPLHGGKYKIISTLSQGGFGITYKVKSTKTGVILAVKEFYCKDWHQRDCKTNFISTYGHVQDIASLFRKKFKKEANVLMSLDHPNIVKVYDYFEENGTAYYVMEYIQGVTLQQYVTSRGRLTESEALPIIYETALTLAYIHSNDQLHLDITPRNIMITPKAEIKLIDFGVSKHYCNNGEQSTSTPIAHSGGYAPKEQYLQEGLITFSPATDIYALSATLYFMLSGIRPPDANERQQFIEEGKDLLVIDKSWSKNVRKTIKEGMRIARKDRIKDVRRFLDFLQYEQFIENEESTTLIKTGTEEKTDATNSNDFDYGCVLLVLWILLTPVVIAIDHSYDSRVADSLFDRHKYEEIGDAGKLGENWQMTYFKVYDPDTEKWGVVTAPRKRGRNAHPDTDASSIVLPILYDSIYVHHELDDKLTSTYTCYGYKDGKLYDSSRKQIDKSQIVTRPYIALPDSIANKIKENQPSE